MMIARQKRNMGLWAVLMTLVMGMAFTACSSDDDLPSGDVKAKKSEGSKTIQMTSGESGGWVQLMDGMSIRINGSNQFVGNYSGVEFVSMGLLSGLEAVSTIPEKGWTTAVDVNPGMGYVVRYGSKYARLYVTRGLYNQNGVMTGAMVQYQAPFQVPVQLESTKLQVTDKGGTYTVKLKVPTYYKVTATDWCSAYAYDDHVQVTVLRNLFTEERSQDIVLTNDYGSVKLTVVQDGAAEGLFAAGKGTADDPFQIAKPAHLDHIRDAVASGNYYYYVLTADIEMSEYITNVYGNAKGWEPISDFYGMLDGQGHSIIGLFLFRQDEQNVGLFRSVRYIYPYGEKVSAVKRLRLAEVSIIGGNRAAGFCAVDPSYSGERSSISFSECAVTGNISSYGYSTDFAFSYETIEDCYSIVEASQLKVTAERRYRSWMQYENNELYIWPDASVTASSLPADIAYRGLPQSNPVYYRYRLDGSDLMILSAKSNAGFELYQQWDFTNTWQMQEMMVQDQVLPLPFLRCLTVDQE